MMERDDEGEVEGGHTRYTQCGTSNSRANVTSAIPKMACLHVNCPFRHSAVSNGQVSPRISSNFQRSTLKRRRCP